MKINSFYPFPFILIGMAGCGKSSIGRYLSKTKYFVDLDEYIEKKFSLPLEEILKIHGNKKFIEIEQKIIKEITTEKNLKKEIIATGGSCCYAQEELKNLKGTIFYLETSWENIKKNIKKSMDRGLIIFEETIEEEFEKRILLYKSLSDITINCLDKNIRQLADEILSYSKTTKTSQQIINNYLL